MAPTAFDAEAIVAAAGNGAHKPDADADADADAGAAFVLESKGTWWHAGFHLTTAIVGPTVLTLPYALRGMGWALGITTLSLIAAVTLYEYSLMSRVLDHCEQRGRRHIRFRELAADVLGSGWMFYFVVIVQTAINTGVSIGSILLAADCIQDLRIAFSYPLLQLLNQHADTSLFEEMKKDAHTSLIRDTEGVFGSCFHPSMVIPI